MREYHSRVVLKDQLFIKRSAKPVREKKKRRKICLKVMTLELTAYLMKKKKRN